jgi:release factor glutamine methyltransferase
LRVLDVGTGSGCLLLAYLGERPNATGLGIDTSEEALAYARRNATRHGLAARCRFEIRNVLDERCDAPRHADAKSSLGPRASTGRFDVILANPPYLTDMEFECSPPEIRDYEPRQALAAGVDGLDAIRVLAPALRDNIADSGLAFVEIGAGQAEKTTRIIVGASLELRRVATDLSGIPRCLVIGRQGQAAIGRH